jgi:hypothetical protein
MPCQSFNTPKLLLMIGVYTGICLFFWRKATLKLSKAADVDENAQSSAIAIVTFFFQTVTLLDIESGFSLGNSLGFLNLEPDNPSPSDTDTEGSCLTTGRFYSGLGCEVCHPAGDGLGRLPHLHRCQHATSMQT